MDTVGVFPFLKQLVANTVDVLSTISHLVSFELIFFLEFLLIWNFYKVDIIYMSIDSHAQLTFGLVKILNQFIDQIVVFFLIDES